MESGSNEHCLQSFWKDKWHFFKNVVSLTEISGSEIQKLDKLRKMKYVHDQIQLYEWIWWLFTNVSFMDPD